MSQFLDLEADDDELSGKSFLSLLRRGLLSPVLDVPENIGRGSSPVQLPVPEDAGGGAGLGVSGPTDESSDDDAVAGFAKRPHEEKRFRFNAHSVFLTYARSEAGSFCSLHGRVPSCPPDSLCETFQDAGLTFDRIEGFFKQLGAYQWAIGRELHRAEGEHYHVFATRRSRFNTSSPRFFDIGPFHPCIRSVSKRSGCLEYVCKDGDYRLGGGLRLFGTSRNFRNARADFDAWTNYGRQMARPEARWPVVLPGGGSFAPGDKTTKRRHLIIYGPPSMGKTRWFDDWFGGTRVYAVPKTGHLWDQFELQSVVMFDDPKPFPDKGLLTTLCEVCSYDRSLPARYNNKLLPSGFVCTVIILCNEEDIPKVERVDVGVSVSVSLLDESWFTERFILVRVDNEYKGRD